MPVASATDPLVTCAMVITKTPSPTVAAIISTPWTTSLIVVLFANSRWRPGATATGAVGTTTSTLKNALKPIRKTSQPT